MTAAGPPVTILVEASKTSNTLQSSGAPLGGSEFSFPAHKSCSFILGSSALCFVLINTSSRSGCNIAIVPIDALINPSRSSWRAILAMSATMWAPMTKSSLISGGIGGFSSSSIISAAPTIEVLNRSTSAERRAISASFVSISSISTVPANGISANSSTFSSSVISGSENSSGTSVAGSEKSADSTTSSWLFSELCSAESSTASKVLSVASVTVFSSIVESSVVA